MFLLWLFAFWATVGDSVVPYLVELQIADILNAGTQSHALHKIAFIGDLGYNTVWYNITDRDPNQNNFVRAQKYSISIDISDNDHTNLGTLRGIRLYGEDTDGYMLDCMFYTHLFVCVFVFACCIRAPVFEFVFA